jgi:thioredoxin 1
MNEIFIKPWHGIKHEKISWIPTAGEELRIGRELFFIGISNRAGLTFTSGFPMKKILTTLLLLIVILTFTGCSKAADKEVGIEVVPGIPVQNTVTLVDLGAKTCIPCKLMAPILEELKEEYKGRAEIIFIDVWENANKEKVRAFKIATIPTQIFYNKKGQETYRHIGFFDKESIKEKLDALLAE